MPSHASRRLVLLGAASALMASCAPTPSANPLPRATRNALRISDITVETGGTAFVNRAAADRASSLAPDLRQSLLREFADRISDDGVRVVVEISQLNVAGGTATATGRDQSRLQGAVRVVQTDGSVLASYTIIAVAGAARETRTGTVVGSVINTASGFYRALIDQFSLQTREDMLGAYLPGERQARRIGGALSN